MTNKFEEKALALRQAVNLCTDESQALAAISSALEAAYQEGRKSALESLSGEIKSVTLGPAMIAEGITEAEAISLLNQGMIMARGIVRADGSGSFEESGATVNVTEFVAKISKEPADV